MPAIVVFVEANGGVLDVDPPLISGYCVGRSGIAISRAKTKAKRQMKNVPLNLENSEPQENKTKRASLKRT